MTRATTRAATRMWACLGLTGLLTAGALVACSSDEPARQAETVVAPTTASSPFTLDAPGNLEVVDAGVGTEAPDWGLDCCGTQEPFTVLSPDGSMSGSGVVIVSTTGFAEYQGQLDQTSAGYFNEITSAEPVDGHPARFSPGVPADGARPERWADLVVAFDEDLALRVTTASATQADLIEIYRATRPSTDHLEPPTVVDPPDDLRPVGSVAPDLGMALRGNQSLDPDRVIGSVRSHVVVLRSSGAEIKVTTLPGTAVDLDAVAGLGRVPPGNYDGIEVAERNVDGRPGRLLSFDWGGGKVRAVAAETAWGDVVVASAQGAKVPSDDQMVALAASVREADEPAWEELVVDAYGGPGLNPDPGRSELARGQADGVDWLLQTGPRETGTGPEDDVDALGLPVDPDGRPDPCLKLQDGKHACARGSAGDADTEIQASDSSGAAESDGLAPFMIITIRTSGSSVRVTTPEGEHVTADLVDLPSGDRKTAVVFPIGANTFTTCDPLSGDPPRRLRIEVLDADGQVTGCTGNS